METEQYISEWSLGHWSCKGKLKKLLKSKENENITYQNKGRTKRKDYSHECLHEKKKTERSQINNLAIYLKLLEKQGQAKSNISKEKGIIKISRINEMEAIRTVQRIKENLNKTEKPLAKLAK
jgi:hypothetical protein